MAKKYWVPALEKADNVLQAIAGEPHQLRLTDLSRRIGIHKSSLFSLLLTMEELRWVVKDNDDTYGLGPAVGRYGNVYLGSNSLIQSFNREAPKTTAIIGESLQLAELEGNEVLYLAKEEVPSPIRLASSPGMKYPAHATALGKALLSGLPPEQCLALYPQEELTAMTPFGLASRARLFAELEQARREGYAYDRQEAVEGFYCVAAPIRDNRGGVIAGVSCSMPAHVWERKQELARIEIGKLAVRLSGY